MKLRLNKEWFETRIQPDEDFEFGAGVPVGHGESATQPAQEAMESSSDDEEPP